MTVSWIPGSLYRPLDIGSLHLSNRVVMAPMTREFAPSGLLDPGTVDYYRRRAAGGAGLIVTEGTSVPHPVSHHSARVPHFYGAVALVRWREVVEAVHAAGSRIFPQLWHCGIGRITAETENPEEVSIGPSVVGRNPIREMDESDVADVITAFAVAAGNAKALGFDGVALHGAHGYLIDSFFWSRTNRRSDRYGGGLVERGRFGVELVKAIRGRVGPGFPIMFRFSQWKGHHYDAKIAANPRELEDWLQPLADAGVDIFDASTRRFWLPEFDGSPLNLAGWAKRVTGRIAVTVGSIGLEGPLDGRRVGEMSTTAVSEANLRVLEDMLSRDEFDLAAVGRILLANPEWPTLVRQGRYEMLRPYEPERTAKLLEPAHAPAP